MQFVVKLLVRPQSNILAPYSENISATTPPPVFGIDA